MLSLLQTVLDESLRWIVGTILTVLVGRTRRLAGYFRALLANLKKPVADIYHRTTLSCLMAKFLESQ